jgi:hypothetical protein
MYKESVHTAVNWKNFDVELTSEKSITDQIHKDFHIFANIFDTSLRTNLL